MAELPVQFLQIGGEGVEIDDSTERAALRRRIEPWLSSLFQSEHLSALFGSGLTTAVASLAGGDSPSMAPVAFDAPHAARVLARATESARAMGRGDPNLEDQIRVATELVSGLEILGDPDAALWRAQLDQALSTFLSAVTDAERRISEAMESGTEGGLAARAALTSILLSFASRTSSRERLNIFTTNYDRLIEHGCDLIGLRPLDRFVGQLAPRFRASRLDIDMHYNPPGIRGEPRYLEGVIKLTKLHGSVDWCVIGGELRRVALPFGGAPPASIADHPFDSLIVYPNAAKDMETSEFPYAELFRDFAAALCRPNSALVTYGYGFGDDHINRVLEDMLSIPSTHLVIIAYSDMGGRIGAFLDRVGRPPQISLLIGSRVARLDELTAYYLPKPAIETISMRRGELLRRRGGTEGEAVEE